MHALYHNYYVYLYSICVHSIIIIMSICTLYVYTLSLLLCLSVLYMCTLYHYYYVYLYSICVHSIIIIISMCTLLLLLCLSVQYMCTLYHYYVSLYSICVHSITIIVSICTIYLYSLLLLLFYLFYFFNRHATFTYKSIEYKNKSYSDNNEHLCLYVCRVCGRQETV